jgi:hypothetical protein
MVTVLKAEVLDDVAHVILKVQSACCKDNIDVIGHYDKNTGLFTEFINSSTGSPIYVGLYEMMINELKKHVNPTTT